MLITGSYIEAYSMSETPLISPFDPDQRGATEGGAYDLRLGDIFSVTEQEGIIGRDKRVTPRVVPMSAFNDDFYRVDRYTYHLVSTIENVHIPSNLRGHVFNRTTIFRCGAELLIGSDAPELCGAHIVAGSVAPGYQGKLTFGLVTWLPLRIQVGARIASIVFERIEDGENQDYAGVWQHGRVSTDGEEVRPW